MDFSEEDEPWESVPPWASFLIEFGYLWLGRLRESRSIAVISMPSDSAAAGLVALGAMRKRLEASCANDASEHYQRLVGLVAARPNIKLWHCERGLFTSDGLDRNGVPWVKRGRMRMNVPEEQALKWRIAGEPPIAVVDGEGLPRKFYDQLDIAGGNLNDANLSATDSHVCLSSCGIGAEPTRRKLASIRFRIAKAETDLSRLLAVSEWAPNTISRVRLYNSRTEAFDRQSGKPKLVIADGDTSFLKVVDGTDFSESDVIGIVCRTTERDRLEAVGTKIENLRQWYDHSVLEGLPQTPRGIGICVLERRHSCQ